MGFSLQCSGDGECIYLGYIRCACAPAARAFSYHGKGKKLCPLLEGHQVMISCLYTICIFLRCFLPLPSPTLLHTSIPQMNYYLS
jgi:hypothetical protein